jgi:predicted Ser/Thr protein kinase
VSAEHPSVDLAALLPSIEAAVDAGSTRLNAGYQGAVHLLEVGGRHLIVKAATGRGPLRYLRERLLRHEYRAYARLDGVSGIPHCHGLAGGRFLVLDYVAGPNARDARLADRDGFYDRALAVIQAIHARGVAHADLKRRDNILVSEGEQPLLLDFGMAVLREPGFHPWNHWIFGLARRLDLNAWIKHKYRYREGEISAADGVYDRPIPFESGWRRLRRMMRAQWRALRQALGQ